MTGSWAVLRLVAATSLLTISAVRATDNEEPKPTMHVATHVSSRYVTRQRRRETGQQNAALTVEVNSARHTLAHRLIFTQVLDTVDRWVKHASKDATFPRGLRECAAGHRAATEGLGGRPRER